MVHDVFKFPDGKGGYILKIIRHKRLQISGTACF